MAKEYWLKKKEDKQWCFKCNKEEHIAKDCRGTQSMKKWKIQEEKNNKEDKKEEGFGEDLK